MLEVENGGGCPTKIFMLPMMVGETGEKESQFP